jgi:hypothetical protein
MFPWYHGTRKCQWRSGSDREEPEMDLTNRIIANIGWAEVIFSRCGYILRKFKKNEYTCSSAEILTTRQTSEHCKHGKAQIFIALKLAS